MNNVSHPLDGNRTIVCDIAVIGGGMGGVAAALAATNMGASVFLSEETDWLGGQMTSQGVSAFDEHKHIEYFGGTRSYMELRSRIRAHYHKRLGINPDTVGETPLNPGNGWVSRLCFEPAVGEMIIREMLGNAVRDGRLKIVCRLKPEAVRKVSNQIQEVTLRSENGAKLRVQAKYFLDATELGDLLPLAGLPFCSGAEAKAETGESHAPENVCPNRVQSFTFPFAIEYCPRENHVINKPESYEYFKKSQPYSLSIRGHDGDLRYFQMFDCGPGGTLPFWTYRRLLDGQFLGAKSPLKDISMINWPGNDYAARSLFEGQESDVKNILEEAKQLSLGFLYWLQTEAPRDDGGYGYPEFKLLPWVMGTKDGLSKYPYIRESRRIVPLERVVEQDIVSAFRPSGTARLMLDSVGVGWYPIDIHPCADGDRGMDAQTCPFQIPLGALIPKGSTNLLAACKNIGVTHITNGSYRLHPVEWNIGEAAGYLAAFSLAEKCSPHDIWNESQSKIQGSKLRSLQRLLIDNGVPLAWTLQTRSEEPGFLEVQMKALEAEC